MTATARDELKAAQGALTILERKLDAARAASIKARALHEETVRQVFELEAGERRASTSLTDRIKAAIKGGVALSFDDDTSKTAAVRSALEGRRRVAEQAVADLSAEELEAEEAVQTAKSTVDLGVKAVMRATAAEVTEQWNSAEAAVRAAEAKSRSIRLRLGRFHGEVDRLGYDDEVWRAIRLNTQEDCVLETDRAVQAAWTSFGDALARDANAKPDFAELHQ
jgi:hypothetical protein